VEQEGGSELSEIVLAAVKAHTAELQVATNALSQVFADILHQTKRPSIRTAFLH
jgi:hypothetical protein